MRKALDTSFVAQFATCKETLPTFDSVNVKWFRQKKRWGNGISAMARSILQFSIWNLISYLDNMCKQTESRPSFILSKASYGRFCIFSNRYIGHIWRKQIEKKHKFKRPAFSLLVGAWSTSCPKFTPKYVQLSGAWPIHLSGSDWTAQLVERKTTALSSS